MTDRDAPHKNPARVPLVLQAMDTAAHHEPHHILTTEGTTNMASDKIEKDGIYKDADGNQFYMVAGSPNYDGLEYVGPREDASTEDTRAKQAAPENKARASAPEKK